nr:MAG TPA: hypothetical protein [Caudoviricetes sp.]
MKHIAMPVEIIEAHYSRAIFLLKKMGILPN